jgi:hypothetical protein
MCTPTVVALGLITPRSIAVADGVVYVAEGGDVALPDGTSPKNGRVSKCTLDATGACTGGALTPIATGLMAPHRIDVDAKSVYWTNEGLLNDTGALGSIMKAPK